MSNKIANINQSRKSDKGGLDYISDILADFKAGKMVIMMDDEDRENEGDLIMAASAVRAQDINFMARYGRGLICLTLTAERCRQLRLPLMVTQGDDMHRTAFTVSIEAAEGVTTGISAHDRAQTIQAAVKADARPTDLVQPGHIFPLMAEAGGVLARAGHTEAGCDLARLSGFEPASVIVEILNEDGTMARRPDLEKFAREHDLKIGTIADLIRYRLDNEHSIERVAETHIQTEFGEFHLVSYQDAVDGTVHLALIKGKVDPNNPTLVRVHLRNTLSDMIGAESEHFAWPLRRAMKRIAEEGSGIIIVLRKAEASRDLIQQIVGLNRGGPAPDDHSGDPGSDPKVLRTYGIGAQILFDLGVRRMRVLSAPKRLHGLSGFGLEVVEYVPCD
tara:strand:+ start:2872 stop:4041 length:1170 start_codon:yes stop_codon:yes gene_type:complete